MTTNCFIVASDVGDVVGGAGAKVCAVPVSTAGWGCLISRVCE